MKDLVSLTESVLLWDLMISELILVVVIYFVVVSLNEDGTLRILFL